MIRLLKRCAATAVKLPIAAAWDAVSLCNVAEGSSTMKVLRDHERRAEKDELLDDLEELARILR